MIRVSDIWADAKLVFGTCTDSFLYARVNDAIELLANKGDWQPQLCYLDVTLNGKTASLPSEVETPLAVLSGGHPVMGFDRLFEFHLNGPGDDWGPIGWGWRDGHQHPTLVDPDGTEGIAAYSTKSDDVGAVVTVYGTDENGDALRTETSPGVFEDGLQIAVQYPSAASYSTEKPLRITAIKKPETEGRVRVVTQSGTVLADYQHFETEAQYRRIVLNRSTTSLRIFCRRTSYKVSRQTDLILLPQRFALVMAMCAVKAYDDGLLDTALGYEAQGARMTAERNSRLQPPTTMPIQVSVLGGLTQGANDDIGID